MRPVVLINPIEVDNRLEELGLTREALLEAVQAMAGAKADCTPNDPPAAPGWSAWRMGVRRLREVMLTQEGWEKDDTDQISTIFNARRAIRIAVSNTDDDTGIEGEYRNPQNRSKKGAATDRAILANQGSFMDVLDESLKVVSLRPAKPKPGPIVTWYLCVFCEGDEVRAELSCPIGVESGFFTGFSERIILLGPDDGGGAPVRRHGDDGGDDSDFDIPVHRKQ